MFTLIYLLLIKAAYLTVFLCDVVLGACHWIDIIDGLLLRYYGDINGDGNCCNRVVVVTSVTPTEKLLFENVA